MLPLTKKSGHIFSRYDGKTILLLGEKFSSLQRTIADVCDSQELHRSLILGTSYLFLGLLEERTCNTLFQRAVLNAPGQLASVLSDTPASSRFLSTDMLADAIAQQKRNGNNSSMIFVLPVRRRWYHLGAPNPERQARATVRRLRQKLPQTRCLVSTIDGPSDSFIAEKRNDGQLGVLLGADHKASLHATEKTQSRGKDLSAFERYMIVASLTAERRAAMIWSDATLEQEEFSFTTESAICSLSADCVKDLDIYAFSAFQTSSAAAPTTVSGGAKDHLRLHLSTIAAVLMSPGAPAHVPRAVTEVLSYCLASCRPQSKTQIVGQVCILSGTRRKKVGGYLRDIINTLLREKGYNQEMLGAFHQRVKGLHSRRQRASRNTSGLIVQRAAELTRTSNHHFVHAKRSASDAVPQSLVWTAEQWDAHHAAVQAQSAKIQREQEQAQHTLRQKLVAVPRADISDTIYQPWVDQPDT